RVDQAERALVVQARTRSGHAREIEAHDGQRAGRLLVVKGRVREGERRGTWRYVRELITVDVLEAHGETFDLRHVRFEGDGGDRHVGGLARRDGKRQRNADADLVVVGRDGERRQRIGIDG